MVGTSERRPSTTTTSGGSALALAGLLMLLQLLGTGETSLLYPVAALALALGSGVLAFGPGSIVGASRVGRVSLVLFGIGPLVLLLPLQLAPAPLAVGMTIIVILTIATVGISASVARTAVLRGVARWAPVLLAAEALLTAAMSSVALGRLPFIYASWHLELIRPVALLIWGLAIVLHGRASAIRRQAAAINAAWTRSTDVSGTTIEPAVEVDSAR